MVKGEAMRKGALAFFVLVIAACGTAPRKPAVQGGFDYAHASGLYAGVWGSNVSWLSDGNSDVSNSLELDIYGGYKGTLGAIGYDIGLLQYYYPGSYPKPYNSPNTLEGYLGLSWEFLSFKYSYAFTDLFGYEKSDGSQYYDLSAAVDQGYRTRMTCTS